MTVLEVIQRSTEFLARKGVESPRLQVELLLAHVLKLPRLQLYLSFERPLTEAELEAFRAMVTRRGRREPLQHILGTAVFCGLELKVNRHVLVPRPETEILAEKAWEWLKQRAAAADSKKPAALDFGTGSGCLAIALATHCPETEIHALDMSTEALALASENAASLGVGERIRFHEGNGFSALPSPARFDLIVSNPPYIPSAEIESLEPEVRDFDPRGALDGGPDGLDFYRMLASEAGGHLKARGRLMLEFGDGQEAALEDLFRSKDWQVEAVEKDFSGKARFLFASPPGA